MTDSPSALAPGVAVLGICYGMQLLVHELGGRVEQAEVGEFGRSDLHVNEPGVLLAGLPHEQTCWMSHRDTVFEAPPEFSALASSSSSPVAAVEDARRGIYGIQFHPEVVHTPYGQQILTRFLTEVSGGTGPETKRKAIGGEFIRVSEEQASRIAAEDGGEGARYLVQGTLYSDVIESGGGTGAATIMSHHNVGGLPEEMRFELV